MQSCPQGSKCDVMVKNGNVYDGIFKTLSSRVSQSFQIYFRIEFAFWILCLKLLIFTIVEYLKSRIIDFVHTGPSSYFFKFDLWYWPWNFTYDQVSLGVFTFDVFSVSWQWMQCTKSKMKKAMVAEAHQSIPGEKRSRTPWFLALMTWSLWSAEMWTSTTLPEVCIWPCRSSIHE